MPPDVYLVVCETCNETIRIEGAASRKDAVEKAKKKKKETINTNCKGKCEPFFIWAFLYDEVKHQLPQT